MKSNLVDIDAKLIIETEKAWLLDFEGEGDGIWIPKSIGEFDGKELTVPEPYALSKGLI